MAMTLNRDTAEPNPAINEAGETGLVLAAPETSPVPALPQEVEFILSALEAAHTGGNERRRNARNPHRAVGRLRLFSDFADDAPRELYSRDATPRDMGFITRNRLPLGYGGVLQIHGPDGLELAIDCTVNRCRETVHGWFEGSVSFNREQVAFARKGSCIRESSAEPGMMCVFREPR